MEPLILSGHGEVFVSTVGDARHRPGRETAPVFSETGGRTIGRSANARPAKLLGVKASTKGRQWQCVVMGDYLQAFGGLGCRSWVLLSGGSGDLTQSEGTWDSRPFRDGLGQGPVWGRGRLRRPMCYRLDESVHVCLEQHGRTKCKIKRCLDLITLDVSILGQHRKWAPKCRDHQQGTTLVASSTGCRPDPDHGVGACQEGPQCGGGK